MSRKFVLDREIAFINAINRELNQSVVGTEIHYYEISLEHTHAHRIYNEAPQKVWKSPVKMNARVLWDQTITELSRGIQDEKFRIEVYIHVKEAEDRNVVPRNGDFVEYGSIFFEITSAIQPQLVFGQINNKMMWKLTCAPAREGQFAAGGSADEGRSNVHPVEQAITVNK